MEEGHQKSKRLSYTAKFKREVICCTEEKGNRIAAAVFGVDESNIRLWRKHKTVISGCEASQRKNSLDPRKDDFLKLMVQSSRFFRRDARLEYL
jgi:transposase-like protein